jgi:hypothetical protein
VAHGIAGWKANQGCSHCAGQQTRPDGRFSGISHAAKLGRLIGTPDPIQKDRREAVFLIAVHKSGDGTSCHSLHRSDDGRYQRPTTDKGPPGGQITPQRLTQGRHCLRSVQYHYVKWLAFLVLTSIATQAIMFN